MRNAALYRHERRLIWLVSHADLSDPDLAQEMRGYEQPTAAHRAEAAEIAKAAAKKIRAKQLRDERQARIRARKSEVDAERDRERIRYLAFLDDAKIQMEAQRAKDEAREKENATNLVERLFAAGWEERRDEVDRERVWRERGQGPGAARALTRYRHHQDQLCGGGVRRLRKPANLETDYEC